MGLNTSAYVGYYVIAKMKETTVTEMNMQCPALPKHRISGDERFCPECGAKVVEVPIEVPSYRSLQDVKHNGNLLDTQNDREFIYDNFASVPSEWVGFSAGDNGYELVVLSNFNNYIDCDNEGVHDLGTCSPSQAQIEEYLSRLKSIMQYESVEMRYGVLVSVA